MSLVLIVDDHEDTCRIMQRLIRRLGPEAECVFSGLAALAFVTERRPALVLLDISMPGMDGLETLRRLREAGGPANDVPVIMVTAIDDEPSRRRAAELGASDYWVKGAFNWPDAAARLRRLVAPPSGAATPGDSRAPVT
jgi:CheY-like chemotaxis protein